MLFPNLRRLLNIDADYNVLNDKLEKLTVDYADLKAKYDQLANSFHTSTIKGIGEDQMLPIFDHYKSIFIHIPKTAGSSITQGLYGFQIGHIPIEYYKNTFPEKYDSFFKFAFTRNPLTRCYSAYNFLKKGGANQWDLAFSNEHLRRYPDFETFVESGFDEDVIFNWVHFKPQHTFISIGTDRRILVDFVGKMENLQEDFAFVCQKIGVNKKLKFVNKRSSSNINIDKIYTPKMKKIIEEKYATDFELFGYSL